MLSKLFKLDYKWVVINKGFLIYAAIAVLSALLTRIFTPVQSPFGSFMRHFMGSVTISMCFSIAINLLVRTVIHFVRSFYRDESYLTHTLPVEKADLWRAKVLAAIATIVTVIGSVVVILATAFVDADAWMMLKGTIEMICRDKLWMTACLVIFTMLFEIVYLNLAVFVGILVGRKKGAQKNLRTVMMIMAFYVVPQMILLGGMYILSRFSETYAALFAETGTTSLQTVRSVLYITTPFYLVLCLTAYCLGKGTFMRGVDVE